MLKTVKIQFQTPQDLAGFRKVVREKVLEADIRTLMMVCTCSKEEIALAMNYYGGNVLEEGTAR